MEKYLKETKLLNYRSNEITTLIAVRKWNTLNEFDKIGAIYDYVQNKILLGYNKYDNLAATEVLADGIGQCNTKATLLMLCCVPSVFLADYTVQELQKFFSAV